ncbi:MAG: hypothetical protein V8S54_02075 [Lachnospiraceae bacterium]|jgi:hypothetical protein
MWENNLGVSDVEGYKRKKGVGRYWKYIKLCAALLLYLAAVRSNAHVQARAGYAAAFLNDRAVTAKEAEQICEAEAEQEYPAAICFFKEQPDTSLFCRETGEASVVNQIRIIGNAELLMYGSNALSFRKNGCYLDTATVRVLFGTDKVAGQTVRSGDQSWQVLGVFDSLQKEMLCVAEEKMLLDRILLLSSDYGRGRDELEQLLLRNGLGGDVVDFTVVTALVQDLLLIVPLLLLARAAKWLIKDLPGTGLRLAATVVFDLAGLWYLIGNLHIPPDLIPTRWSDFSFWSTTWMQQRQNFLLILKSAAGEASLDLLWHAMCAVLENLLAVCLLLW